MKVDSLQEGVKPGTWTCEYWGTNTKQKTEKDIIDGLGIFFHGENTQGETIRAIAKNKTVGPETQPFFEKRENAFMMFGPLVNHGMDIEDEFNFEDKMVLYNGKPCLP